MIGTELSTLPEQFFNNSVVFFIPIDLSLRHKNRNIFFKTFIEFFQRFLNSLVILGESGILNTFSELSQRINISVCNEVELSQRFFRRCLLKDDSIDKLEIFLIWHLVSKLRVFSKHISSKIIVSELAVEEKEIAESFRKEWRVLKQKVEFFERAIWIFINVHQGLVQKCNGIEFFFRSRRHIKKSFSCSSIVLYGVLDSCFEIESFNKSCFF